MTYAELTNAALDVVGRNAIGWVMTTPDQGGEEVFFYDHDAQRYEGASRADVGALLLKRWPKDAPRAIDEMHTAPDRRWVVGVAGEIFVWFSIKATPRAGRVN
jgi:hypothetical protein